jgi:hypothetical protein
LLTDKTHEYRSIDIDWMRRNGCLRKGIAGRLTWSRADTVTGSINYSVDTHGLRLRYRTRPDGGESREVDDLIRFAETGTNFSGRRRCFLCPTCGRKCRILYGGSYFRCRYCHRLKYESQYEPPFARAASRALKIRARLGCEGGMDEPFAEKPKGMHWRTYNRLKARDQHLQNAWAIGLARRWHLCGEET